MNSAESSLEELCLTRQIDRRLEAYLSFCDSAEGEERADSENICSEGKAKSRSQKSNKSSAVCFPNVAGFCRFLGVSTGEFEKLANEYPNEYGRILAVFEDEALNSGLSATLISAYLKKRLGYDTPTKSVSAIDQMCISFEHDIMKDGE